MKKQAASIFFSLLLALFSCSEISRSKDIAAIDVDTLTTEKKIKRESFKQEVDNLPNELLEFVPKDYAVLDTVSGDLNLDELKDYILVLRKNGEDTLSDVSNHPESRPLLMVIRNEDKKLQLVRRNNNTVYCIDCGGVMGDPFIGVTIESGYFSVHHYGGSAWRWTRDITYQYSRKDNEWFLHKDSHTSFHATEPEEVERTIKTTKDFGRVKFEDFDIYNRE